MKWIALLFVALGTAASAARLEVTPERVLEGDPVSIRIVEAAPGSQLTLHAQSAIRAGSGQMVPFHAYATYRVNRSGIVDLATAAPIAGTYSGADLRGLFWSQQRLVPEVAPLPPILAAAAVPNADEVVLTLQSGDRIEDRKTLTFVAANIAVTREEVRTPSVVGAFYSERGTRGRPVVVILHGSEGGIGYADWLGPMLVARGYAVFGLVYYSPRIRPVPGVPEALNGIPVESIERVRTWLAARPEADVERFGIVGASKGGEFALLLASIYPWIDAVAAFVPSAWVNQGFNYGAGEVGMGSSWSRSGRDLPFVPETGLGEEVRGFAVPGGEVRMARVHRENLARAAPRTLAAAAIQVERGRAAYFLAGGGDDQAGDSGHSVAAVAERLRRFRYPRPFDARVYPEAGHLIVDTGWRPTTTHNNGPSQDGGTPRADAHAQADSWAGMIAFLERELKGPRR
ncbi:MAG TPA: acyl-CoA thioester hydrolase/BAAT C-terminal domain-containing protein [Allosphingosinicella sp.]|nr:acyl-CoA thioester hydrolase/BAAT C-terminal domain-containing protein [Allosphingosinicella sp.]